MIKQFVLDTNVLLHDPTALFKFEDNHVIVPIVVIEELDHFKKNQDMRGQNARRASNAIDALKEKGSIHAGVPSPGGGTIRVAFNGNSALLPEALLGDKADNHILACALANMRKEKNLIRPEGEEPVPVILVSKDTNLRIKAEAMGLRAEDYENDRVPDVTSLYAECKTVDVDIATFETLTSAGSVPAAKGFETLFANDGFVVKCGASSVLAKHNAGTGTIVNLSQTGKGLSVHGITPKNKEQRFALDLLLDPRVTLVTLAGKAGTGKTLLAIAAGLQQVMEDNRYSRLVVSRPVFPMGKDIGFLPGTVEEKLNPWMQPIFDNIECLYGGNKPSKKGRGGNPERDGGKARNIKPTRAHEELIEFGFLEVEPLMYIRGRSMPNQFLVVDEAQNLTPHEVKTILTRAGENTKIVLTGDPFQIDNPFVDAASNGLSYVTNKFRGEPEAGHVTLIKGERSALAEKAANIL